jgi:hypothetical protein
MRRVELVVWAAARRLAFIVLVALSFIAIPFVQDARIGPLPAVTGGLAVALLVASFPLLLLARREIREAGRPAPVPAAAQVYRASAKAPDCDGVERAATHHAAVAFLLLAAAGSLLVVAAAAR